MNVCSVFTSKVAGTRKVQRNYELVFGSHVVSPGHRLDTGSDLGSASKPVEGTMKRLKFNRPKYGRCNIHLRCQCLQKVCMQNAKWCPFKNFCIFAKCSASFCIAEFAEALEFSHGTVPMLRPRGTGSRAFRAWSWVLIFLPCKSPGYGTGFNLFEGVKLEVDFR